MHKIILLVCMITLYATFSFAAPEFMQEYEEFLEFKKKTENEFEDYKKQLQEAFTEYKKQAATVWGNKQAYVPDNKTWVQYYKDMTERSIVDFERGRVTVEIAVSPEQAKNKQEIQNRLKKAINRTLTQGKDERSILEIAKKPVAPTSIGPAILQGQVNTSNGDQVASTNADEFYESLTRSPSKKNIKGDDGKKRVVYRAQFNLVPDHIKRRAQKYQKDVNHFSKVQKMPPELVFAVIETESFFNPTARSSIPAFGLMQLVPSSGARDAYKMVYKKDQVVTDRFLYDPKNNIQLGSAYLHILYYDYLKNIKQPESRQWAAIAAYNTGTGNVLKAFVGHYSKSKFGSRKKWNQTAYTEINKLTPEQVYKVLQSKLPFKETRSYIKKVRNRMPKYTGI